MTSIKNTSDVGPQHFYDKLTTKFCAACCKTEYYESTTQVWHAIVRVVAEYAAVHAGHPRRPQNEIRIVLRLQRNISLGYILVRPIID
jgi:hypothetical protein